MPRHISNVVDIKPKQNTRWTSLVQVLENGHTQKSLAGNEFKRLVLTDSQGTQFTALISGDNNIRYFAKILAQYKRYYISNAFVVDNEPKYRIGSYPYSWILSNRTLVEEYVDPIPASLACGFEFTKFSDLYKYADTDSLQNVKAIVLKCFPSKEQGSDYSTNRTIVIVDEEKKLLMLTLWNPFDENEGSMLADMVEPCPMIIGLRLRVTIFNSLSLTTRSTSGFMINPPVTEDLQMQSWYNTNKAELQQLLELQTYKNVDLLLPYPKEEDIVPVATAVTSLKTIKTCWVKGKISLQKRQKSLWHTACASCKKALEADVTWIVTCPSCGQESEVQAMSNIAVQIDDGTATIHAAMYTPQVEKLVPFTALQLKQSEEDGIDLHNKISMALQEYTIVAFLRTFESAFNRQSDMKITIVQAYIATTLLTPPNLMPLPAAGQPSVPCSSVTDSPTNKGKDQLFTPSTRLVLEEINTTAISKSVKRSLPFTKEDINPEKNPTTNNPQNPIVHIKKEGDSQVKATSPSKKNKDR